METPILSVVIPAHNVAADLPGCVDSLLTQKGLSFEVILVDDSSDDETGAICDAYAARDPRVRTLHCGFRDVSLTRNAGLELARGEYVGFCDGDDASVPEFMPRLAEVLRSCRPDLVRFGYRECAPEGGRDFVLPDPEGLCSEEMLKRWRLDGICPAQVLDYSVPRLLTVYSHVFRREFLEEHAIRFRSQHEILSEDYLFILQALYQAECVYHLPAALYHYMVHPGSLSRHPKPRMMERKRLLMEQYLRFLPTGQPEVQLRLRNFYIDSVYDCFVNACTQSVSRAEALERIRPLLEDPELHRCIRENRERIASSKAKGICFLMEHRMAGAMYLLYRLLAGQK